MSPSSDQKEPVVEPAPSDDQSNGLTARALRQRIRQQELLAELGVLALQRTSFIGMLDQTARMTAEGLDAEYCKVMEYLPAENAMLQLQANAVGDQALSERLNEAASRVNAVGRAYERLAYHADYENIDLVEY